MSQGSHVSPGPGLYVHVPFCEALCSYCDFYSVARGDAVGHRYVDALRCEIEARWPEGFAPDTVFVGGGTPTALSDADFDAVLHAIQAALPAHSPPSEWSVECNPGSLTEAKAAIMRQRGVTRVSIGVQSFDDRILRSVGRVHDAAEARDAVRIAHAGGIESVSIDLLFALPGQGIETFRRDLHEALELGTDHISAYALLYEEGTTLTRMLEQGRVAREDEGDELAMLRMAEATLSAAGFSRYEISNFASPGRECRHNVNYWRNGAYLGLGPGAVTYLAGERRKTVASWRVWQAAALAGTDAVESTERLPAWRAAGEEVMVRMRLAEGAPLRLVDARWNTALAAEVRPLMTRLAEAGLVVRRAGSEGTLILTARGIEVSDAIAREILALCSAASQTP